MIGWEDVYKVVTAMTPLCVALALGYASVKWWHMFTPDQFDAINRFNCFFIIPFFNFKFISHINPYELNYPFLGADCIAKCIVLIVLVFWTNCTRKGSCMWSITAFSLCSLNNTLIVGVPLLKAMYGEVGEDLVVQSSVIQSLVWVIFLLFMLEFRREWSKTKSVTNTINGDLQLQAIECGSDLDQNSTPMSMSINKAPSIWSILKIVWLKLAKNPNFYACIAGLIWALLASRWQFKMPEIIEGSILIMSKAGAGVSMFSMGLFMALQERVIACGTPLTLFGMALRFVVSPATMAIGSIVSGLHGNVLRIALIQAALPQSIASFVYAQEYGLHPDILSTAVIFGTIVSLPLLIAYYALLEVAR
ncbi:unnamed protein product [Coffea canephora]|uniref:Auxin efflux carrier component n=2 Tax=Coffea TaxID=13442 RepID=A0A068UT20_COFCA|nr:auxin efflux carrier component 5-like [Coffea arabica]CDP11399.1 unnamed protein product [Coffea canephora]